MFEKRKLKVLGVAMALSLGVCPSAVAQTPAFEKVLVPVFLSTPLPGAFGSNWITDFWIANSSEVAIDFAGGIDLGCSFPPCPSLALEPGVSFRPRVLTRPDGLQGTFVFVESGGADRLSFELRFRDLSRQAQTWGTELPVARERDFRTGKISLVDIPISDGFRQMLRVYSLNDDGQAALVRVRAYAIRADRDLPSGPPDVFLGQNVFPLQFIAPGSPSGAPGFLAVGDLSAIAPLSAAQRIRLEIEPVSQGLSLWAFVTVVNNETQHATVITPH